MVRQDAGTEILLMCRLYTKPALMNAIPIVPSSLWLIFTGKLLIHFIQKRIMFSLIPITVLLNDHLNINRIMASFSQSLAGLVTKYLDKYILVKS